MAKRKHRRHTTHHAHHKRRRSAWHEPVNPVIAWTVIGFTALFGVFFIPRAIVGNGVGMVEGANKGFDQYGYNRTARLFNGTGMSWCMGKFHDQTFCDGYIGDYAQDKLVMKWNAEWDRGNQEKWLNPPYAAWEDNEWNGKVRGGSGEVWHYKIVWDKGCKDNNVPTAEGGYCIWGQFETLMDQGIAGTEHMWFTRATPNGYGVTP